MLEKPQVGQPCNGCGLCCEHEMCDVGAYSLGYVSVFGECTVGPCPALETLGERRVCGLYRDPSFYLDLSCSPSLEELRSAFSVLLSFGCGCSFQTEGNSGELRSDEMPLIERLLDPEVEGAMETWFGTVVGGVTPPPS